MTDRTTPASPRGRQSGPTQPNAGVGVDAALSRRPSPSATNSATGCEPLPVPLELEEAGRRRGGRWRGRSRWPGSPGAGVAIAGLTASLAVSLGG